MVKLVSQGKHGSGKMGRMWIRQRSCGRWRRPDLRRDPSGFYGIEGRSVLKEAALSCVAHSVTGGQPKGGRG